MKVGKYSIYANEETAVLIDAVANALHYDRRVPGMLNVEGEPNISATVARAVRMAAETLGIVDKNGKIIEAKEASEDISL